MNRRTGAVMLGVGLALAPPLAGCGGEGEPPAPAIVDVGDITAEDCDVLTNLHYPETDKEWDEETRFEGAQRDLQEAANFAINRDLDEATARFEAAVAEAQSAASPDPEAEGTPEYYSHDEVWSVTAEAGAFLADPEGTQGGLIAQCAALAGEVTISETLLDGIEAPETRAAWEDQVENWQAFTAEQLAEDGEFDEAYEILPLIDDEGNTTNESAHEEVELWVEHGAEQLALDPEDLEEALELTGRVDNRGERTEERIRDGVEEDVIDAAKDEASIYTHTKAKDFEKALDIAELVDNRGEVTRVAALDAVEAEIAEAAVEQAQDGDYSDARELADMVDDEGEVTRETVMASL